MSALILISYSDAKRAWLTRYYTGQPCQHGHLAERLVSNRTCISCAGDKRGLHRRGNPEKFASQRREWARKNPERSRAAKAAWAKDHPEVQAWRSRKWFLANREKANAATRASRKKNPGRHNAQAARQRAAWSQRVPQWADKASLDAIYECARAMRDAGVMVEVDHVVPLRGERVSGLHVPDNLQIIPALENRAKSNHYLEI